MARPRPPERLAQIAESATRAFGRLGYRRTHMADVAADTGLSSGAIYTYVESKEALFHVVFLHAFGFLAKATPPLPLATPAPGETVALIGEGLRRAAAAPLLRAAVATDALRDVGAELTAIVEEQYAIVERLWPVLAVIETCAVDLPELDDMYFQVARPGRHGALARYLSSRAASGHLRTMPDADVAARLITEAVAWFAWHRRDDRNARRFDDALARRTVVEFVCDALLAPGR